MATCPTAMPSKLHSAVRRQCARPVVRDVLERHEGEGGGENGAPPAQVDDHGHRGGVPCHPGVEPQSARIAPAHELRARCSPPGWRRRPPATATPARGPRPRSGAGRGASPGRRGPWRSRGGRGSTGRASTRRPLGDRPRTDGPAQVEATLASGPADSPADIGHPPQCYEQPVRAYSASHSYRRTTSASLRACRRRVTGAPPGGRAGSPAARPGSRRASPGQRLGRATIRPCSPDGAGRRRPVPPAPPTPPPRTGGCGEPRPRGWRGRGRVPDVPGVARPAGRVARRPGPFDRGWLGSRRGGVMSGRARDRGRRRPARRPRHGPAPRPRPGVGWSPPMPGCAPIRAPPSRSPRRATAAATVWREPPRW